MHMLIGNGHHNYNTSTPIVYAGSCTCDDHYLHISMQYIAMLTSALFTVTSSQHYFDTSQSSSACRAWSFGFLSTSLSTTRI